MPADQPLSRSDLRQIAKSNRIVKFMRYAVFAVIGLIVVVDGTVILADFQDRYLFASIAKTLGVSLTGNACNIAVGAKVLFWLQLAIELGIVAFTLSMKPSVSELEQAHRAWDLRSIQRLPRTPLTFLLFVAFAALCYSLSYALGYIQTTRYRPCSALTLGQVGDYWLVLLINAARGITVVTFCGLYLDHKATKVAGVRSPLT